jgi:hypothetical protein
VVARHLLSVFGVSVRAIAKHLPPPPLEESNSESITTRRTPSVPTRDAFTDDPDSGWEYAREETEDDEDEWGDDTAGMFDFVTERDTEQNALIATHASSRNSSLANLPPIIPA